MDIVSSFNPARLIEIGGERYWCRTTTIEDLATIIAWIDDVVPGQAERSSPVQFRSDEAQAALNSPAGLALMVWIMLRRQGVSYDRAWVMSQDVTPVEKSRLISVLFARRRTYQPSAGTGEDIANMVVYLCSDQGAWISGQLYTVDGGMITGRGSPATRARGCTAGRCSSRRRGRARRARR